jgi:hypothetical protein
MAPLASGALALALNRHAVTIYVVSACCASFVSVLMAGVWGYATM